MLHVNWPTRVWQGRTTLYLCANYTLLHRLISRTVNAMWCVPKIYEMIECIMLHRLFLNQFYTCGTFQNPFRLLEENSYFFFEFIYIRWCKLVLPFIVSTLNINNLYNNIIKFTNKFSFPVLFVLWKKNVKIILYTIYNILNIAYIAPVIPQTWFICNIINRT